MSVASADGTAPGGAVVGRVVAVVEQPQAPPDEMLRSALQQVGLPRAPDGAASARALVLLDFDVYAADSPALVTPRLVEHLLDLLAEHGWSDIAIASTADSSSLWLENRSVAVLADLLGYQYITPAGTEYEILDLSEQAAQAWRDAALRIVFAKCKTDQHDTFTLCCGTLMYALPLVDKDYHYRFQPEPWRPLLELLEHSAPHLAIVDACGAVHGSGGQQQPRAIATHAIIAGDDALSVDCAVALKMGLDPSASPLVAGIMAARGRPSLSGLSGSLAPFAGMLPPDPLLVESTRRRDRSPELARLLSPWLQRVDTALFPFKNPIDAKCNGQLAPRLDELDGDGSTRALLIYANQALAAGAAAVRAYQVGAQKDQLLRSLAEVSPEALRCTEADFAAMERELGELRAWLAASGPDGQALRWRRLDGAVLFECRRDYPVPFSEFTERVEIWRAIRYMNDYLGGSAQALARDAQGRPLRQAERNVYLPQPNYVAWWGGKHIDVSKIESLRYDPAQQRMVWKTVKSENDSARFDDGIVTFSAVEGGTRVEIFGRQLFALPPLLSALKLEHYPELYNHLTEHAYSTFFERTFANFEALLEGREIAIGRAPHAPATPYEGAPRPMDALAVLLSGGGDAIAGMVAGLLPARPEPASRAPVIDVHGFRHFTAADAAAAAASDRPHPVLAWAGEFWTGYGEAMLRDLDGGVRASRHPS